MFTNILKVIDDVHRLVVILWLDRRIQKLKEKIDSPIAYPVQHFDEACCGEPKPGNDIR